METCGRNIKKKKSMVSCSRVTKDCLAGFVGFTGFVEWMYFEQIEHSVRRTLISFLFYEPSGFHDKYILTGSERKS